MQFFNQIKRLQQNACNLSAVYGALVIIFFEGVKSHEEVATAARCCLLVYA